MLSNWEDKGAFLIPAFVTAVLVAVAFGPTLNRDSIEGWIRVLTALLTPLIAIMAYCIARQQKEIAHQQAITAERKLKHDLYDRRFAVYDSLIKLIGGILSNVSVDTQQLNDFAQQFMVSYFLFDKDVQEYLEAVNQKVVRLWAIEQTMKAALRPGEPSGFEDERKELVLWFVDQQDTARMKFSKYLTLNF